MYAKSIEDRDVHLKMLSDISLMAKKEKIMKISGIGHIKKEKKGDGINLFLMIWTKPQSNFNKPYQAQSITNCMQISIYRSFWFLSLYLWILITYFFFKKKFSGINSTGISASWILIGILLRISSTFKKVFSAHLGFYIGGSEKFF